MVGDASHYVEAVAVDDGVIVYAGDTAGLADFVGDGTEQQDLERRTMLPGFVDPHRHVMMGAADQAARSVPNTVEIIRKVAAKGALSHRSWPCATTRQLPRFPPIDHAASTVVSLRA